jgi:hypothetical protein
MVKKTNKNDVVTRFWYTFKKLHSIGMMYHNTSAMGTMFSFATNFYILTTWKCDFDMFKGFLTRSQVFC